MSEPLAQALRIPGASLIMLTSMESRTTVWSAGLARVGAEVAALGAAITEAAAEMVRLTAGGVEMDDLLVTSPAHFHVLRVVDGQVAHLVLDRDQANLAMARHEFRQLVAERSVPAPAALPAPEAPAPEVVAPAPAPGPASPGLRSVGSAATGATREGGASEALGPAPAEAGAFGAALEGEVLPASSIDFGTPEPELPRLPQRRADAAWADDPTDYQTTIPTLPDWLRAAAEGPFMDDSQTLDRVVGGLRRL